MGKRSYVILSFLLVSIIIFIFSSIVSSPLNFISNFLSTPRAALYLKVFAQKETELEKLKKENLKFREELAGLEEIKKDNDALRAQFEQTFISSQKLLPARVVGSKGGFDQPTSLILDQGESSGIKIGMAVVLGKTLVGKIGKVTTYNSEINLVSNKNFSTLGATSKNNAAGVVKGQDDFIIFDHVVITDTLSKDEDVVAHGEQNADGVGISPGLLVGKITEINKVETRPFQDAIIKSPLDFRKLAIVFVIIK